jgi:myo-inositol catabolism protein IolC
MTKTLDVICIGRSSVDLYGQQVGKGFAIGRTIFGAPARAWMAGEIDDDTAVARMTETYGALIRAWDHARSASPDTRPHSGLLRVA